MLEVLLQGFIEFSLRTFARTYIQDVASLACDKWFFGRQQFLPDNEGRQKAEQEPEGPFPSPVEETERPKSTEGTGLDEKSTDFAPRHETPVTYGEGSTKNNNELRDRRGESHYDQPPPEYSRFPPHPPDYNASERVTGRQSSPKYFYQDPGNTTPKRRFGETEFSASDLAVDDDRNNRRSTSAETSQPFYFESTEDEPQDGINLACGVTAEEVQKEIKVPVIKADSPVDSFPFDVDKNGCRVETQYCKLNFPPGAVKRPIHMKMRPDYNYVIKENTIQICPTINFSSDDEMIFDKKVTVSIHTSYTAIGDKKISLKVMRRKDSNSPFEVYKEDLRHGSERYVEFDVNHFCGYTVEADESQFRNMQKNYYSVVYMKKPKSDTIRYLNWLIYDDCPGIIWERLTYLESKDLVTDPEIFPIRHNHNLQLSFDARDVTVVKPEHRSPFSEKWGSRVNESFQFKITRDATHQLPDSEITYEITARHARTQDPKSVLKKGLYLEWQREESAPSMVFNVHGDRAVGMTANYRVPPQSQISSVSDASSGIVADVSDLVSTDTRVEEQDESVSEEDDNRGSPLTIPKSEIDSLLDCQPVSQSTPRSQIRATDSKEEVESVGSSQKSFSS